MVLRTIIYGGLFNLPDEDAAAHRVNGIGNIMNELGFRTVFVGVSDNADALNTINNCYNNKIYFAEPKPINTKQWLKSQTCATFLSRVIDEEDNVFAVILYNFPSVPFEQIKKICKKKKIKIFADCTEWHHYGFNERFSILKNIDAYKRMKFDNKNTDGLIVISSYLENHYKKQNCFNIPPVFDYNILRKNFKKKCNNIRTFVFTGTVSKQKETVRAIVEAACNLKDRGLDFCLNIFGISEDEYLHNEDSSYEHVDSVNFYGRVPHEVCLTEIQKADFQIFNRKPTRVNTAGFPTKFAESFALGTPVITTKTSDVSQHLIDGETGFLINKSIEEAMERAITISDADLNAMCINVLKNRYFDYRTYIMPFEAFLEADTN